MSSDNGEEVTPVSIPNTEVKLFSADGSWDFVPVRVGRCQAMNKTPFYALIKESRGFLFGSFIKIFYTMNIVYDTRRISSAGRAPALQAGGRRFDPVILHHRAGVAQLVEQLTCNQ